MKRIVDLFLASVAAVVLSPVVALIAVVVKRSMGSPILFRQTRPGLHGAPFEIVKFRTMANNDGPAADRITPTGATLRRWSLDELPELWNVLTGDMSIVGPRPLLTEYLPLYSEDEARRHNVRPGITGLAQVRGRNDTTWEERLRYDLWYVDNHNLWVDAKIAVLTLSRVLSGVGVNAEGTTTMPPFTGGSDA